MEKRLILIECYIFIEFRYDPYSKEITREYYDTEKMHEIRQEAIKLASRSKTVGVIQGTLGRQGSRSVTEVVY